jgi:RNA polymerase sigma-70 factor (ECF subfamily)
MAEPERDDRLLVRRMSRGDEAAFTDFFESHFPPLYRFALRRMGGNEQAAEEIAQTTLCNAMRKLGTYRGEASLLTWLMTFCRHEIFAYAQREQRLPAMVDLAEDSVEIRAAFESMGADDALLRKERSELVQSILDRLPLRYGDILEWKYLEGLSVVEIAERLGVSPKAAESQLTRARVAFRDAFATVGA